MILVEVLDLLRFRWFIFFKIYNDCFIDKKIIEEVLENVNWVFMYKLIEFWWFKVFRGKVLECLFIYFFIWYKDNIFVEKYFEKKFEKIKVNLLCFFCVIVICM